MATPPPLRTATTTGDDSSTRARVIEAAVDCILQEGFYRASSNRIARRAGVTWGVIQYHFGTREGLLLAVFQESADQLEAALAGATITGDTVTERLESLAGVIWTYYRRPEFLAYMQILLNLSHDPSTAPQTVATLVRLNESTTIRWHELLDQTLEPHQQAQVTPRHLFAIVRGLAIGQQLIAGLPDMGRARLDADGADPEPERTTLVRALACLIEGAE